MADHNSRMVEDHIDRLGALEKVAREFEVWKAAIMIEHAMLKEGVANFKVFKERGTKFFDRAELLLEESERRRKRNATIAIVVGPFILALAVWGGDKMIKAAVTIYDIEEQWKLAHPSEFKQKSLYDTPPQVYAENKQQYAGGTMMPTH